MRDLGRVLLNWFSAEKVGRLSCSAISSTLRVSGLFAHYLVPVVSRVRLATVELTLFVFV